jgi:23S rRNA pseudouridine1911/1915/1917 synthase
LIEFGITEEESSLRIDKYLKYELPQLSRTYLQKLLDSGDILVSGKTVKQSYLIAEGDIITVNIPESEELNFTPEDIPLDILYEDDHIIVVNKPKQMVVHPAPGHYSGTLVNALLFHCRANLSGINGYLRPGIVHRIDMDTTGSLVVCKTDLAHKKLSAQLKAHSIKRVYEAIAIGRIKESGEITFPIGRDNKNRKKMSIRSKNPRNAYTKFKVISQSDKYTYLSLELMTGRTHQIRVHLSAIGHPILGDVTYGPAKSPVSGLIGQCLHAKILGFEHPVTGEYMEFSAPTPSYFEDLLMKLDLKT